MIYLVQIVDKPDQIIVSEASFTLDVLVSVKYIGELNLKVGSGPVEAMKLLQDRGIGEGHEEHPAQQGSLGGRSLVQYPTS